MVDVDRNPTPTRAPVQLALAAPTPISMSPPDNSGESSRLLPPLSTDRHSRRSSSRSRGRSKDSDSGASSSASRDGSFDSAGRRRGSADSADGSVHGPKMVLTPPRAGGAAHRVVCGVACGPDLVHGLALLMGVTVIWVAASVAVQYIFSDLDFNRPFFLTYVSNSLFVALFPVQRGIEWCRRKRVCGAKESKHGPASLGKAAWASAAVGPVWFLAQGTYNWSLDATTVSSSTILSTTSCLFTLAFSMCFLKEGFTWGKGVGVVVTILGAVFVGLSDDSSGGQDRIWGDILCLLSAVMYGVYTVMIRKNVPDDGSVNMAFFFGTMGLINAVVLFPVVIIMHFTGYESLSSLTPEIFFLIVAKGTFDNVISDLMWAKAIMLTSPTVATVALSLTIPLSMLADWAIKADVPTGFMWAGSLCVIIGFVTVTLQPSGPKKVCCTTTGGAGEPLDPDTDSLLPSPLCEPMSTEDHALVSIVTDSPGRR